MIRSPAVLTCLAAAVLLAGCGQSAQSAQSAAHSPVLAATPVTTPAPMRFDSVALMAQKTQESVQRSGSAHLTTTITTASGIASMDGDFRFDADHRTYAVDCLLTAPDRSTKSGTVDIHEILLPEGFFAQFPQALQAKIGTPWAKLNTASKDPQLHSLAALQQQIQKSFDFKGFMPTSATITKISPDELNDGPATRYDITLDVAAAAKDISDPTQQGMFAELAKKGITSIASSVWVDNQNHPRKIHSTLPLSKLGKSGVGDVTTDLTMDSWGKSVSISAPPADQVTLFPKN